MAKRLNIGVVGCGMAGPAAAALLARDDHHVTIFDKAPACEPVGAGFLLQPAGISVLQTLGLYEEVLARSAPIKSIECVSKSRRRIFRLEYETLGPHSLSLGAQRCVVLAALTGLVTRLGVAIKWATHCTGLRQEADKVILNSEKEDLGAFDLIVVADGARSLLRSRLSLPIRCTEYPWGALWFIGEDREQTYNHCELFQIAHNTRELIGFLPTGFSEQGVPLVSFFWSVKNSVYEKGKLPDFSRWKEHVLSLSAESEPLLAQINDWHQLPFAKYYDVSLPRWHENRVVLIGDAAHAMSPQLGQGVNLGLSDAFILSEELRKDSNLHKVLENYSKRRKSILTYYQCATRWATPFFQSDYPLLGIVRNLCFPLLSNFPPTRKEMTRTMAGLKSGFFC